MAATVSHIVDSVHGNHRLVVKKVTNGASSATADVTTGLDTVVFAYFQEFAGGAHPSIKLNETVAGSSVGGAVALTSGTSAGSGHLIAFGD